MFAKALLDVLDNTVDVIEGRALYRAVAARVAHAAAAYEFEQTPSKYAPIAQIAHAGHEAGDFFLQPISR